MSSDLKVLIKDELSFEMDKISTILKSWKKNKYQCF